MRRLRTFVRLLAAKVWNQGRSAHALAIVGGWALVTWGVASLTQAWETWPIAGGLLLLSLAGWGHLRMLFTAGVYALSRASR